MLRPPPKLVVHTEHSPMQEWVQLLAAEQCKHRVHGTTPAQLCSCWSQDHRLPTGSNRVMAQPLPPGSSPAALLCVESSQKMITALRRACFQTAQPVLAPRSGICTKPVSGSLSGLWEQHLWKAQGYMSAPVSHRVKAALGCERHQLLD